MSGWDPGSDKRDEIAFGSDDPAPSLARSRLLIGAVAAVCLVAGWLVGTDAEARAWLGLGHPADRSGPVALAGVVEKTDRSTDAGPRFDLQVFNEGVKDFTVEGIVFDGLPDAVVDVEEGAVLAGERATISFSAPPDCDQLVPDELASVRLTVRPSTGPVEESTTPLPGGGRTLVQYHDLLCGPQDAPRADQLLGMWVVDQASPSNREGAMLWRFEPDRTFTAGAEGARRGADRGVAGHYRLRHGRLVIDVDGGYRCASGDRAVGRPSLLAGLRPPLVEDGPHFAVTWLGGACAADAHGEAWILRRVGGVG